MEKTPDTQKNWLGLAFMLGLPEGAIKKMSNASTSDSLAELVEIPEGHIEDRIIEIMEIRLRLDNRS